MPRYLVESTLIELGARAVLGTGAEAGVTWLHSYLAANEEKLFSLYEGPTPEAIRRIARRNGLPIDCIHAVTMLDPYPAGRDARAVRIR